MVADAANREATVRQLGTLVSVAAVPALSLLVLATIVVMGGAGTTICIADSLDDAVPAVGLG